MRKNRDYPVQDETPRKNTMAGQRDRGGYNSHGHEHPKHTGRKAGDWQEQVDEAPKLARKGLTPQKTRTRP